MMEPVTDALTWNVVKISVGWHRGGRRRSGRLDGAPTDGQAEVPGGRRNLGGRTGWYRLV